MNKFIIGILTTLSVLLIVVLAGVALRSRLGHAGSGAVAPPPGGYAGAVLAFAAGATRGGLPPADAAHPPTWKAQDNALPATSGPGLVVCEPVPGGTAPGGMTPGEFGAGCAYFLQLAAAGQPEMGKTPLWSAIARAHDELGGTLRLSPAEAVNLAPILGVTHAAVGTVTGSPARLTLTYRLLTVPGMKTVGAPLVLSGTSEQVTAGLPGLAAKLARACGVAAPRVPTAASLSADDVQFLGRIRWLDFAALPLADQQTLDKMAEHSPVAGIVNLTRAAPVTDTHMARCVQTLLTQAGDNPQVWGELAFQYSEFLVPHRARLEALSAAHPANFNLTLAEVFSHKFAHQYAAARADAERLARLAPHNPQSWVQLGNALSDSADDTRHARFFGRMSSAEAAAISPLYDQWERAVQRAVKMDPYYGRAWTRLAQAAAFNGDDAQADPAFKTAMNRDPDKPAVYRWGLQMYQPKWEGSPVKLLWVATAASRDVGNSAKQTASTASALKEAGFDGLAQTLRDAYVARQRARLAKDAGDGDAHWAVAILLKSQGDQTGATAEYRQAAAALPDNPFVRDDLGNLLYDRTLFEGAIEQYRACLTLDPQNHAAHYDLGYALKHKGELADAQTELQTALRLNPYYAEAHFGLGEVYQREKKNPEAIKEYQAAVRYGPYFLVAYEQLCVLLDEANRLDESLAVGAAGLQITKGDTRLSDNMADVYLKKRNWKKSIELSQASLETDGGDALAHVNLGEAYNGMGQRAKAHTEWQKALTMGDSRMSAIAQDELKKFP